MLRAARRPPEVLLPRGRVRASIEFSHTPPSRPTGGGTAVRGDAASVCGRHVVFWVGDALRPRLPPPLHYFRLQATDYVVYCLQRVASRNISEFADPVIRGRGLIDFL